MKYNISINQLKAIEYGLNPTQAAIMELMGELSTWAEAYRIGDGIYYRLSSGKISQELPLFGTSKSNWLANVKVLKDKDLLDHILSGNESYYRLSEKGKLYFSSEEEEGGLKKGVRNLGHSVGISRDLGVGKKRDNNNTITINKDISKDISTETPKKSRNSYKEVDSIISIFKTILSTSGFVYDKTSERVWASNLSKSKEFIEIFGNVEYGMLQIMKYANQDSYWSGKICSLRSFYYAWVQIYNKMKKAGLVKSLEESRLEEERKRKMLELL